MKRSTKFLAALIIVLTLMMSLLPLTVVAANEGTVIYLAPNDNWKKDNARFAMYIWSSSDDYKWIDMTDADGDGIYEGVLPAGYTNIIFGRMDPNKVNGWSDNKCWNQTANLTYDGKNNLYTIAADSWSDGSWSAIGCRHDYGIDDICKKCGKELFYIVAGYIFKDGDNYAEGDNTTLFGSKWDVTDENNRMEYDSESGCYVKIYKNVAKGEYEFKVAVDKSWDVSYGDNDGKNLHLVVEESGSTVLITLKDGKVTFACSAPMQPDNNPENDGNTDNSGTSDDSTSEPGVKLNFFQKIWLAIRNFFAKLFGKKA